MSDLELAVRTIESILPDMSTEQLQKWRGIFTTALVKLDAELDSTMMHTCDICGLEEYGFRTELPVGWRANDEQKLCFDHDHIELKRSVKPVATVDETVDELMAML